MLNFETYRRAYATGDTVPLVAIHLRGIFGLSKASYEALKKPSHVRLLYDQDQEVVGFKPTTPDDPHGYKVRKHEGHSYQVAGASFLKHFAIPDEVRGQRYKAALVNGVLAIRLREAFEE